MKKDLDFHIKPHLISFSYPDTSIRAFNYVASKQVSVLCLDKNDALPGSQTVGVTHIVLLNGRELSEEEMVSAKGLKGVILSGITSKRTARRTEELCRKFAINFYNTVKEGAFILPL